MKVYVVTVLIYSSIKVEILHTYKKVFLSKEKAIEEYEKTYAAYLTVNKDNVILNVKNEDCCALGFSDSESIVEIDWLECQVIEE
jgi:hypothetical protein